MPYYYALQKLRASDLEKLVPVTVEAKDTSVTDGTTTSTTFTNTLTTTGVFGIAFTAGMTGTVEVKWTLGGRNSTAGQYTVTSFEVRSGTGVGLGSVVWAADENVAVATQSDSANHQLTHAGFGTVSGLTPGTSYNACIVYRVTANTGTYSRRRISVTTA